MQRQLMILEVSQKQAYIFEPRELRENRRRSKQIERVTSPEYFLEVCTAGEYTEQNMVYSGGGHTVLQFEDAAQAKTFAQKISLQVLREYPQMELFIKQIPYDANLTPGQNLNRLTEALEKKKSLRRSSFRTVSMGIEKTVGQGGSADTEPRTFQGWKLTSDTGRIANDGNFIAVVHIDGNAMGKRVQKIYDTCTSDWDVCVAKLRQFSEEIDRHFDEAYREMAQELITALEARQEDRWNERILPLRRLIAAGDDVCFVCTGYLGLECAARFLQHLSEKTNGADGQKYSACAGVVLIHTKFPFRQAYDLSEALCSNAKVFAAKQGEGISAIDYHIEFGQMKASLSAIRADYRTEDGGYLNLRPLAVVGQTAPECQYDFLTTLIDQMQQNQSGLARSKVKGLRTAFHQGEQESALALRMTNAGDLLYRGIEKRFPDWMKRTLEGNAPAKEAFFADSEGKRRCLYFDAIEFADNTLLWRPVKEESK